jgi:hypothetical protein
MGCPYRPAATKKYRVKYDCPSAIFILFNAKIYESTIDKRNKLLEGKIHASSKVEVDRS